MLEFCVLGSGSGGNSAVVRSGRTRVLVDAGLSARQLEQRLNLAGIDPDMLDAVLLTHEHGDHTRGIEVFCKKRSLPVYCNIRTREVLRGGIQSKVAWKLFESGDALTIGDLRIQTFEVPHDAVEPTGFVIRNGHGSLGLLSDLGKVTHPIRDRLRGVDSLFVEANYDLTMLQNDTKRPWSTKQRICSPHGHLSNDQAAELVAEIAHENFRHVVLGHLSRDCNSPDAAIGAIRKTLDRLGHAHVEVFCASQDQISPFFKVAHEEEVMSVAEMPVVVSETREMEPARRSTVAVSWEPEDQMLLF